MAYGLERGLTEWLEAPDGPHLRLTKQVDFWLIRRLFRLWHELGP